MKTDEFDFYVPEELIAQNPTDKRSDSKMLVYYRQSGKIVDAMTVDLTNFIDDNYHLVFNNSKVIPARFMVEKKSTGTKGEILVTRIISKNRFEIITDSSKKYKQGTEIVINGGLICRVIESLNNGVKVVEPIDNELDLAYFDKWGEIPLPPYIKKVPDQIDKVRYQTLFGKTPGSSAAPTAGLHFDEKIFQSLNEHKIGYNFVSLHVGLGTFQPIYSEDIENHQIHTEEYYIEPHEAESINKAVLSGKKIIPVGTTSLRTLETVFDGIVHPGKGESSIYIYPGYKFKIASGLFTNFHTPKSSLAVLVSSLIGLDKLKELYSYAVDKKYRFFSYGDSMLIL